MSVERYALYGRVIGSELGLAGVNRAGALPVDWSVDVEVVDPASDPRTVWFHVLDGAEGARATRFGEQAPQRYVVSTETEASFLIDLNARRIGAHALDRVDAATGLHLLCDQIVPLALAAAGDIVLHAAAVARDGIAIAFAGPSGSGKSTLAAAMAGRGWSFLTDDALRLEVGEDIVAWPGYPSVRLWPDSMEGMRIPPGAASPVRSGSGKGRVAVENAEAGPVRLARLYILDGVDDDGVVSVERVEPRGAVIALARSTFRLDFRDGTTMAREFALVQNLFGKGILRRLRFVRSYGRLDEVVERLGTLSNGTGE